MLNYNPQEADEFFYPSYQKEYLDEKELERISEERQERLISLYEKL